MRRAVGSTAALVLALGWFWLGAPVASLQMLESHARSTPGLQLPHLTSAVALTAQRSGDLLPTGAAAEQAASWMEEAVQLEAERHSWAHRAAGVLSPSQLELARTAPQGLPPRSRQWPATPSPLVALILEVSERYGSDTHPIPPNPADRLWEGATGEALERGLLAVVRQSPDLTEEQARAMLTAALIGMRAHEVQAQRVQDLARLLGPAIPEDLPREMIQHMPPDRQGAVARQAVALLKKRAQR